MERCSAQGDQQVIALFLPVQFPACVTEQFHLRHPVLQARHGDRAATFPLRHMKVNMQILDRAETPIKELTERIGPAALDGLSVILHPDRDLLQYFNLVRRNGAVRHGADVEQQIAAGRYTLEQYENQVIRALVRFGVPGITPRFIHGGAALPVERLRRSIVAVVSRHEIIGVEPLRHGDTPVDHDVGVVLAHQVVEELSAFFVHGPGNVEPDHIDSAVFGAELFHLRQGFGMHVFVEDGVVPLFCGKIPLVVAAYELAVRPAPVDIL